MAMLETLPEGHPVIGNSPAAMLLPQKCGLNKLI
jgi:hypothetical protein